MASSKNNWYSNIPKSELPALYGHFRGKKIQGNFQKGPATRSTQGYVAAEVERVGKISGVSLAAEKKVGMASHGQPSVVDLPRNHGFSKGISLW